MQGFGFDAGYGEYLLWMRPQFASPVPIRLAGVLESIHSIGMGTVHKYSVL